MNIIMIKSMLTFNRVVISSSIIIALIYLVPFSYCVTQGKSLRDGPVSQVIIKDNRMIIQGTITKALARKVYNALSQSHDDIKTVLLTSIGGDEDAATLINHYLNDLGPHKTIIPSGFSCQSACIFLADTSNTDFQPADDATLMFHRGWSRIGPDSCAACRVIAWEFNKTQDIVLGNSSHREMFRWAEDIAPGLGRKLSECTINPFDHIEGRTITGKQFKSFRAGQPDAVICPA